MAKKLNKKYKIIRRDYLSFILFLANFGALFLGSFAVIIWLFTIPTLIWRVKVIKKILKNEFISQAKITRRFYGRGKWWIYYSFYVNDNLIKSRNIILGFSLPVSTGDEVEVHYDPNKLKLAFLPILYSDS